MANRQPYVKEISLTILALVWCLFTSVNVNVTLGQTYVGFALASLGLLIVGAAVFDKKVRITFQKQKGGTLKAIFYGFVGYVVLLVASVLVLRIFDPQNATFGSIIQLLGAATPVLAQSKIANFITFAFAIPFIETSLWARGLEFVCDLFKIPIEKKGLTRVFTALVFVILLLALAFLAFHLTAKLVSPNALGTIIIVGVMMIISLCMVVIFGETRQAIWTHIWANGISSYIMLFVITAIETAS